MSRSIGRVERAFWIVVVAACMLANTAGDAAQQESPKDAFDRLLVREQLLVGEQGQPAVVLQSSKEMAGIMIQGSDDTHRADVILSPSGLAFTLCDKLGQPKLDITIFDKKDGDADENEVRLSLYGETENEAIRLYDARDSRALLIFDRQAKERVSLGINGDKVINVTE
jgi:hypothetical protein